MFLRIILVLLCTYPLSAKASTFWDTSFDTTFNDFISGNPSWDPSIGFAGEMERGASWGYNGTPGVRFTYTDLSAGGGPAADRFFTLTSKNFWTRWYYKTDSGFQCSSSDTKIFNLYNFGFYPNFIVGCESGFLKSFAVGSWDLSGDVAALSTGYALTDGQWHCLEWNINYNDAGVSNGSMVLYVDGTQVGSLTGRQFVAPSTQACPWDTGATCSPDSRLEVLRLYKERGLGNTYYDNIATGDTRIGCLAGGSGGGPIVMFITQSALAISTFLQALFIACYFWERRSVAVHAAVKFWRYAAEVPTPKEMYWAYRYKKAVKRWQRSAPLMLEHQPMKTIDLVHQKERARH